METPGPASRAQRPRATTAERRDEILRAAMETFAARGFHHGSLADVAERVGMTHAGVLHHFGSKDRLLLEVLEYRDRSDVEDLEGRHMPSGLVSTAVMRPRQSAIAACRSSVAVSSRRPVSRRLRA